jgi:hypothetical protein
MAETPTAAAPTTTTEPPEPHEEIKDDTLEAIEALPENADQLLKAGYTAAHYMFAPLRARA